MLDNLKREIRDDMNFGTALESAEDIISTDHEDIRDTFLDDTDAILIGSEDDPVIDKLIDKLPDTVEEDDPVTDSDIEELIESYIPESILD